ncbi:MAG: SPOR domain-containing protein [Alphaproteobacteria bacterium]|nr:SPOR domain-containing protein [Alphaproteobacteria bacterium]
MMPSSPAEAAKVRRPALRGSSVKQRVVKMPASPTDPLKDAALVIDGGTGKVLYSRNETAERHPASLTKMMTLYLLFEALKAGKVTMETPLSVSAHATVQKPTKLNLRKGESISVDTAIRAIVIRSANDVAVVIAEALGGTEGHFAEMMTEKAKALGMKETNFHNASGLPDPLQITTATDLGVLARHLAYDFPQYFWYFGLSGFNYKGVWYPTHDNLIGRYDGADGIKTGYTGASGFNLVTSVVRDDHHIIGVVMGGRTALRRDLEMVRILDEAFAQVAANPTLVVAKAVPWHQYGEAAPVVASLSVASGSAVAAATPPAFTPARPRNPFSSLTAMVSPALGGTAREEDEDAAEKKVAADEDASILAPVPRPAITPTVVPSTAALPAPNAVKPLSAKPVPAIRPAPRPEFSPPVALVARAMPAPPVTPQPRPALRTASVPEGDTDNSPAVPQVAPGHNWTIQIGAYADKALAQAQLTAYAEKARDVLGTAAKIVSPATNAEGHTLWRARFGPYAENEARDVCTRLTSRGQTCFAAVASTR